MSHGWNTCYTCGRHYHDSDNDGDCPSNPCVAPVKKQKKWEAECVVQEGVARPTFKMAQDGGYDYTSGFLKYLFPLNGKKVKITIELID